MGIFQNLVIFAIFRKNKKKRLFWKTHKIQILLICFFTHFSTHPNLNIVRCLILLLATKFQIRNIFWGFIDIIIFGHLWVFHTFSNQVIFIVWVGAEFRHFVLGIWIKVGLISEGIFNLVQPSKKWFKSLIPYPSISPK